MISMKQCSSKKSTCSCKDKPDVHKGDLKLAIPPGHCHSPSGEIRQGRDRFLLNCEENERPHLRQVKYNYVYSSTLFGI